LDSNQLTVQTGIPQYMITLIVISDCYQWIHTLRWATIQWVNSCSYSTGHKNGGVCR
jgi:hypothetical protein